VHQQKSLDRIDIKQTTPAMPTVYAKATEKSDIPISSNTLYLNATTAA
jgi:hypothetical protein